MVFTGIRSSRTSAVDSLMFQPKSPQSCSKSLKANPTEQILKSQFISSAFADAWLFGKWNTLLPFDQQRQRKENYMEVTDSVIADMHLEVASNRHPFRWNSADTSVGDCNSPGTSREQKSTIVCELGARILVPELIL